MSSHAVEPGTRLVDRYLLEEPLAEAEGTTYWKARDELLDRPVGVCLLADGHPHAAQVLRAARRAAVLTDPRFLRLLDASEVDGGVYVVSEWVAATNLVDLLADGPLDPEEARRLAAETAAGLAAAHEAGLAHLCLVPEHVLRTTHGQVKIGGLAVDAAVHGLETGDHAAAARRDTASAAGVAYAALTARWPGGGDTAMPAAPRDGAGPCSPRQVRAGIPHDLDAVVCRALDPTVHTNKGPLTTPSELAQALTDVHATTRIAVPVVATSVAADTQEYPSPRPMPYDDQAGRRRGRLTRLAWATVVLVLVVGLTLAISQLVITTRDNDNQPGGAAPPSSEQTPQQEPLDVAAVTSFDPLPDGNGEENGDRADLVLDQDGGTAWTTKTYNQQFGPAGIKDGVGLVLDLGKISAVREVRVVVSGGPTGLQLRASEQGGNALDDFGRVAGAAAADADGPTVLKPTDELRARYLLVWLTELPSLGSGFRGEIAEITVRG